MPTSNQFLEEDYSSGFEIEGVNIKQTVSESFNPFSGVDIDTNSFQNTEQSLRDSNDDGRIPLGCFVFNEDNIFSDDFSIQFRDEKFNPIPKQNLIVNGSGKGVQSRWTKPNISIGAYNNNVDGNESSWMNDYSITPYIPTGTWGYCTYDAILKENKVREPALYTGSNLNQNAFEDYDIGEMHLLSFEQTDFTAQEKFGNNRQPDHHRTTGSVGWFPYFFDYVGTLARPQAHLDLIKKGYRQATLNSGVWSYTDLNQGKMGLGRNYEENTKRDSYSYNVHKNDADEFFHRLFEDNYVLGIINNGGGMIPTKVRPVGWDSGIGTPSVVEIPNVAKWIITDEAYSYGKCLEFLSTNFDVAEYWSERRTGRKDLNRTEGWDWDDAGYFPDGITNNQHRSLNQVCDVNHQGINQHTVFEIKFKMKTDSRFYNTGDSFPAVELSMHSSDGTIGDPKRTYDRVSSVTNNYGYYQTTGYWPQGEFNSQRYNDDLNSPNKVHKRYSGFGSMGRFQNTELDTWEEFSYTFSSGRWFHYWSTRSNRNLYFMVQAAGRFLGRVLLDDFEVIESYDFIPDCDVRKKISVGNYGKGDLTKYYDRELQPQEYKDTQGPLEAQFYFYPTYRTEKTFDVSRTPMYRDFKQGLFYIYDVDWGDGSPREFTSEPEQLDEEKALYHLYKKSGVFEIRGTMIRMKPDKHGKIPIGLAKNKKFRLRININEGTAEDFEFFGSDGFSFIPFKNTTPVIGGVSKQSSYYKVIKRQLGFIGDIEVTVPFKYDGDKFKTELALSRADSSFDDSLELLSAYKQERTNSDGDIIFNGLNSNTEELGKGLGDSDVTCIKYYNEPKSIWEMFGFNENDLNIGIPNHRRYWKNIIPDGYSIFNRQGISTNGDIDIYSEQDWMDVDNDGVPDYYYPVLPKYGADGRFLLTADEDGNPINGVYPITTTDAGDFSITEEKKPFPLEAPITAEFEKNQNLRINIVNEKLDTNVFEDLSGNQNIGFGIFDYTPKFDIKTLAPKKIKRMKLTKTSTNNGAF